MGVWRAPSFWAGGATGWGAALSRCLTPLGWAYAGAGLARRRLTRPWRSALPVVCVGNLVAGGAGKTPVAQSLAVLARGSGLRPYFLTRGYGGSMSGPVLVDVSRHRASEVGDEPLLLSASAPTVVSRDRRAGARLIEALAGSASGALIVMDDGFQNPTLMQTLSLLVIDAGFGFGNGRVLPAGPLREPLSWGLGRAGAVAVLGEGSARWALSLRGCGFTGPVLWGGLSLSLGPLSPGMGVLGFAGIGRPEKFRRSLEASSLRVVGFEGFSDHHVYRAGELAALRARARALGARLVTTQKDWFRLPPLWRDRVTALPARVLWADGGAALSALLGFASGSVSGSVSGSGGRSGPV